MSGLADTTLQLSSGARIPQVGLGVWQTPSGTTTRQAVAAALDVGYRHIDTARIYGNEADVGAAVRASGVAREAVFVTTKLWNADQRLRSRAARVRREPGAARPRLRRPLSDSLARRREAARLLAGPRAASCGEGRARSDRREQLPACRISRSCWPRRRGSRRSTRSRLTPFLQRRETRALCAEHGIVVEAYSPLTHGQRLGSSGRQRTSRGGCGRSAAQVLLRWGLQQGLVVLPKSTKPARIAENGALFDFTLDDRAMKELDALEEMVGDPQCS